MKPRAAWPVLAKKAKEKCEEAQANVSKARDRVTHLQQSRERMEQLYADYVARSKEAEKRPHSMSETCLLYTSPSPRDRSVSRMPSSA